jgi:hypothetical protein
MNRASSPTIAAGVPGSASGWPVLAVATVLILAALGAYWNSFNVPFLFDDNFSIGDNPSIRQLEQIGDVLAPPPTAPTAARPLLNLTFALNYAGGGLSVRGYHVVNLLIHICAGLALLGIVRRTLLLPDLRPALTPHPSDMGGTPMPPATAGKRGTGVPPVGLGCGVRAALRHRYRDVALPLAACVALIWMLHPLQTESVTYISQRAESLMGLLYLLTLYGFIRSVTAESRNCWLILSVVTCFCGMATKEVMVTAPVLVLLYDRAFVSGSFRSALANRRWYYVSLATAWLWLGFLMHRSSLAAVSVGFQAGVSWLTYALTELRVVTDYIKLALWPHPLVFDYGSEILATDPLTVVPYAVVIAIVLIAVMISWRRSPMAGFLGCWFLLILAPTSTVVPIAEQPMAESRMYLPLAGVVVLVTLWGYALDRRRAFVALGLVAVGLGVLTFYRNYDYRSELSIWEDTVARHPHTSRGHYNLGVALAEIPRRSPDAIAHYEEALRLKPDYAEAHFNFAIALAKTPGQLPDAIAHYEEALRLRPGFAEAHYNLAAVYAETGRLEAAIEQLETAARLDPAASFIRDNMEKLKARNRPDFGRPIP